MTYRWTKINEDNFDDVAAALVGNPDAFIRPEGYDTMMIPGSQLELIRPTGRGRIVHKRSHVNSSGENRFICDHEGRAAISTGLRKRFDDGSIMQAFVELAEEEELPDEMGEGILMSPYGDWYAVRDNEGWMVFQVNASEHYGTNDRLHFSDKAIAAELGAGAWQKCQMIPLKLVDVYSNAQQSLW